MGCNLQPLVARGEKKQALLRLLVSELAVSSGEDW